MYRTIKVGKISTSKKELKDLGKAWAALSLAFAFIFSGVSLMSGNAGNIFSFSFAFIFVISLFTAGIGFLFHELAHKLVAQRYGCVAEFRAANQMLYLAMGLAFIIGFIFAAPGAVMIAGRVTRKENGLISLAGPLTNFVLGGIFLGLMIYYPLLKEVFSIGFRINFWLGLFNLIPFGPLDGLKIFQWNRAIWLAMAAVGVYFIFIFQPF